MNKTAILIVFASATWAAAPAASLAAPVVQECAPPGGVWGPGNAYRGKVRKFADNTAVYMSQNVATTTPERWFMTAPFAASGGQFTNAVGVQMSAVAAGDGYDVETHGRSSYHVHFTCAAVQHQ